MNLLTDSDRIAEMGQASVIGMSPIPIMMYAD